MIRLSEIQSRIKYDGIVIRSFGYHRGLENAEIVIDLRNVMESPHWSTDSKSSEYQDSVATKYNYFIQALVGIINTMGFKTVSFGCGKGQHRSVAMAELVAKELEGPVMVVHRDWVDNRRSYV